MTLGSGLLSLGDSVGGVRGTEEDVRGCPWFRLGSFICLGDRMVAEEGLLPMGTSGSRKLSRVGRGGTLGTAIPYVNNINSSAGNITYIPGPHGAWRIYPAYTGIPFICPGH